MKRRMRKRERIISPPALVFLAGNVHTIAATRCGASRSS